MTGDENRTVHRSGSGGRPTRELAEADGAASGLPPWKP